MLGYGHDESAPTPGGVFAPHFVGGCYIISKPFATLSQTVSSRRGPIYRAHIYVNTHEMGDEYVQLVMLGYGHDESAPTPDGVFAPYFVGER